MIRHYRTIYIYVIRELLLSFFVAFLFFFFIFFVNQLLLMADEILSKKVMLVDVLLLVFYSIPIILLFSVPFGALVGALMAVGRLNSDNEILALRACGISAKRIFLPIFAISILIALFSFFTNDFLIPLANIEFKRLNKKMILSNPGIELEAYRGKHYKDSNATIINGDVIDNIIYDITIFDKTEQDEDRIISANQAYLEKNIEQEDVITLHLEGVYSQVIDKEEEDKFEYSFSESMIYNILLKSFDIRPNPSPIDQSTIDVLVQIGVISQEVAEKQNELDREKIDLLYKLLMEMRYTREKYLDTPELLANQKTQIDNLYTEYASKKDRTIFDKGLQKYLVEIHRKFSFPFSCIIFIIIAFPIGLLAKKSGRMVGFGVGLFISIVYWGLLLIGFQLGNQRDFSPMFAMWLPNLVVLFFSFIFMALRLRK